jgi:VCBS repeat-containing protein
MKVTVFFNPENLKAFRSGSMDTLYLSYSKNEKYYGIMELDADGDWKFEMDFQTDLVLVKKKNNR